VLLEIFNCNFWKIKMTSSGEKMDCCSFRRKSCYFSILSYSWDPSMCMLATCYHYRTGRIQLVEVPEVLSYCLALVPTMLIWSLAEAQMLWSHLELQLVGRTSAVIFCPLSFLNTWQFSGEVFRLCKPELTWCSLVSRWGYFNQKKNQNKIQNRRVCSAVLKNWRF